MNLVCGLITILLFGIRTAEEKTGQNKDEYGTVFGIDWGMTYSCVRVIVIRTIGRGFDDVTVRSDVRSFPFKVINKNNKHFVGDGILMNILMGAPFGSATIKDVLYLVFLGYVGAPSFSFGFK